MITPSGVTSAVYWNAIKAGNPQHIRITFLGQGIVLDDSDVDITNGATLTDIINGDTDLVFGKAVSKQLHVSIINSAKLSNLQWTGEFTLEMGVEINGSTEWVQVGIFSGEKPNNVTSVQIISFTAYDRMMLFDQLADKFAESITYPVTLATIYNNLCAYVGIQKISGDELPNIMNRSFPSAPAEITGYTCRDILSWIAEACGCYATIDETGKVRMVWFTDNTAHAITGNEEFSVESVDVNDGMTWDEADQLTWDQIDQMTWNDVCGYRETYMIDRILVKQLDNDLDINYPEGITDGNTYMIVDNPFLSVGSASDVTNYIVPLYDRMVNFGGYLPVELSCVGDWCVEAGDMVTIDVGTFTVAVPIFSKTMHWNGSAVDDYETTGQKSRAVYTTDSNKQKVLNSKEIRLLVDGKYYAIKNGIIIDEDGVSITAGKLLKLLSGAEISVEAGTDITIKSGGKFIVDSGQFDIDEDGNASFGGELNAASGTFAGELQAASGTFTGELQAASGTFSGDLQAAGGSFKGYIGILKDVMNPGGVSIGKYITEIGEKRVTPASGDVVMEFSIIQAPQETEGNWWSYGGARFWLDEWIDGPDKQSYFDFCNKQGSWRAYSPQPLIVPGLFPEPGSFVQSVGYLGKLALGSADRPWGYGTIRYLDCKNIYTDSITSGAYNNTSSREVKDRIKDLPDSGKTIDKLRPVEYEYKKDPGKKRFGLIHEEVAEILPEICVGIGEEDPESRGINYIELIPILLKEIQGLRKRVHKLEKLVAKQDKEGE